MTTTTAPGHVESAVPQRRWVPSFLGLGLAWGCSFAFVKVGLEALTPVQVAFGRLTFGALTLLLVSAATRARLPRSLRTWGHLTVLALLLNAAPFTLFAFGQQSVSSIFAGIINATTPLATLAVTLLAFREERPTRQRVVGLLIGFIGLLLVLGVWRGFESGQWAGVISCVAAVVCYGIAFPYSRRYLGKSGDGPVALATGQVSLAAVLMIPVLLVGGTTPHGPISLRVVVAMALLGAVGTGVAYVWNFNVLTRAGATTASSVTYMTPVVAASVGVTFLGEDLTWNQPLGAVIVLLGIAIVGGRLRFARRT